MWHEISQDEWHLGLGDGLVKVVVFKPVRNQNWHFTVNGKEGGETFGTLQGAKDAGLGVARQQIKQTLEQLRQAEQEAEDLTTDSVPVRPEKPEREPERER